MIKRSISVLGSTGSIGTGTLDIIRRHRTEFELLGLSAGKNVELLAEQVREFAPRAVAICDQSKAGSLAALFPNLTIFSGPNAATELVTEFPAKLVMAAVVGSAGLSPTMAALAAGADIALANKESLVMGGKLVMAQAARYGCRIIPVDSEHSAILQCLNGANKEEIKQLVLTASGGPFRRWKSADTATATKAQALNHPNWAMGAKVTIDSASMMNKGMEVIEARWLFDLPPEQIGVLVHPQSIVHSMVEFIDGTFIAQMGVPDMRLPIQYALFAPRRPKLELPRLNLLEIGRLDFEEPDLNRFPCLGLAFEALRRGQTATVVLNAANEAAVSLFLAEQITFGQIPKIIESELLASQTIQNPTINDIIALDNEVKRRIMAHYS